MADSRTYVRVTVDFDENPKIEQVGEEAAWLYICGLCYAGRNLTDGRIPKTKVTKLVSGRVAARVEALLAVGLWVEYSDHYQIHDYLEHQRSREQIENERRSARERAAKSRRTYGARTTDVREPVSVSVSEEVTPPTPPPGGSRAEGTNPRALAAKRERDRLALLIATCAICGDNQAFFCETCTGLRRKLSEVPA